MDRNIMNTNSDVLGLERRNNLRPPYVQFFEYEKGSVQMVRMPRLRVGGREQERKFLQLLVVLRPDTLPLPPVLLDLGELWQPKRCCQISHVVLESRLDDLVAAGSSLEPAPRVGCHAVQREDLGPLKKFRVAGYDHAAVAGGDVFRGIKAETADLAHQARCLSVRGGFDGVRAVLNDMQPMLARDLEDRIHVTTTATHVDHENPLRSRRNSNLDLFRIDVEGVAAAVHQNRLRAGGYDGVDGGAERHRGSNHFIASPNSQGGESQVNRGGTAAHRQCVRRALVACELLLEVLDTSSQADPLAANTLRDRGNLLLPEHWSAKNQTVHARAYRSSACNCRQTVDVSIDCCFSASERKPSHSVVSIGAKNVHRL